MAAADYIVVLSNCDAIAWVVQERRLAFPPRRIADARQLAPGDRVFLYATRGAFKNSRHDRGRIFGEAEITTPVTVLEHPVEIAGREFTRGCGLKLCSLAPMRDGTELAPLVSELSVFPDQDAWGVRLRRSLLRIASSDATILRTALQGSANQPATTIETYRAPAVRRRRSA